MEQWPNNHEILFQKAEYLRYIWQTEAAIDAFRHVYNSATSGDLRRRAAFSLSRALHAAATFGELEELQRTAYLKEASRLISDLEGAVEHVKDVALLKDHIAVELGEVVDWLALDDMREIIIGSEYNFPTQLLQEFDKLKDTSHGNPANITQLLESSFADPDVLGLTGSLYTRRVEKGASNDQLKDCERAIGFICAAAVLERSWEGRERAVTNFRLGKAILSAAQARGTSNPISAFKLNGKADQLAWAESRFQSAADRSTGALRAVSIEHGKRTAQLRMKLAKDNSAE